MAIRIIHIQVNGFREVSYGKTDLGICPFVESRYWIQVDLEKSEDIFTNGTREVEDAMRSTENKWLKSDLMCINGKSN